jgi:hypothetical protein
MLHPQGNDPIAATSHRRACSAQVACIGRRWRPADTRGTIVPMVADTMLTTDAMLAHSVATWDDSRPPVFTFMYRPIFNGTVALHQ